MLDLIVTMGLVTSVLALVWCVTEAVISGLVSALAYLKIFR